MPDDTPKPQRDPDDFDPKDYAHRAANPFWMDGFQGRVRYALKRAGFEIARLVINPDESMATFWAQRGQEAQPVSLDEAHTALREALNDAGCRCGEYDLTLAVDDGHWDGAFAPFTPGEATVPRRG